MLAASVSACSAGGGETGDGSTMSTEPMPSSTTADPAPPSTGGDDSLFGDGTTRLEEKDECLPGVYEGMFAGEVSFLGIPLEANGTVRLTLGSSEQLTSGEFTELTIENGVVEGAAGSGTYRADVIGTLNCETLELENGGLLNGVYNGVPPLSFEGPVTGRYDIENHTFVDGTWSIADTASKGPLGGGTWTAAHVP